MSVLTFSPDMIELIDTMGTEMRCVNTARVSFNKWKDETQLPDEQDKRLIKYLIKNGHESPLHHIMICFSITMPVFLARQWFKHTIGFTRNEISRRYVDFEPSCYMFEQLHKRNPNKKQGCIEEKHKDDEYLRDLMKENMESSIKLYNFLISQDVPPEQCRAILPQSMMTTFIETASLSAYLRLIKLRCSHDAQYEIRMYSNRVLEIIKEKYSTIVEAYIN